MTSRERKQVDLRAMCAQLYPDDGVDPRDDKRRDDRSHHHADRKLQQLCKQAKQALQLTLHTLPEIESLVGVWVVRVEPAPHAGRLCATVAVADVRQRELAAAALERAIGRMRDELARAITRRRTPELTFAVVVDGGDHG